MGMSSLVQYCETNDGNDALTGKPTHYFLSGYHEFQ